jgi:hypothetical protein
MREEIYPYHTEEEYCYTFTSISADKRVQKVVLLTETEHLNLYNVALLDVLNSGALCDQSETRNQDMPKVLATTFNIIERFLSINKNFRVIFKGSEEKRQRLYRIVISKNLNDLSRKYIILGLTKEHPEHFQPNQVYDFYIIGNKL